MERPTCWDDEDLLLALRAYEEWLTGRGLSPATIKSEVTYARRFLDWRTGRYWSRGMPLPTHRPVPAGKRDLAGLIRELAQYQAYLRSASLRSGAVVTYVGSASRFVHWLGGTQPPTRRRNPQARSAARRTIVAPSSSADGLAHEYARIRDNHRGAIVRTVARTALPGSVGRVFKTGTTAALKDLLPGLPVDRLSGLADEAEYGAWYEAALEPVAATILELNPSGPRSRVHPGYKWGHAAKVLSLFVRDLVLFSRYFTEDEARRIEWWLYCPVDGIVMDGLRGPASIQGSALSGRSMRRRSGGSRAGSLRRPLSLVFHACGSMTCGRKVATDAVESGSHAARRRGRWGEERPHTMPGSCWAFLGGR